MKIEFRLDKHNSIGCIMSLFLLITQTGATMTANEAIALLEMRGAAVQDYYLVLSTSFYNPAYSLERTDEIVEEIHRYSVERRIAMGEELDDEFVKRREAINLYNNIVLSSHYWNGSIYTIQGIGTRTYRYSMCSISSTIRQQLREHLRSPWEEFAIDFWDEPQFKLNQVLLRTPLAIFDVNVSDEREPMAPSRNLYQPTRAVEAIVRSSPSQGTRTRSFIFPFEHESILDVASDAETEIQPTPEGNYRLRVKPANSILRFEVVLNDEGDVLEFVRKHVRESGEEWVEFRITYDLYVTIEPEGIRVPMLGVKHANERLPDRPGYPMRESFEVINVKYALVNVGYTLDDLSITLPAGSSVVDYRSEDAIQRIELNEDTEITAAQLVNGVIE